VHVEAQHPDARRAAVAPGEPGKDEAQHDEREGNGDREHRPERAAKPGGEEGDEDDGQGRDKRVARNVEPRRRRPPALADEPEERHRDGKRDGIRDAQCQGEAPEPDRPVRGEGLGEPGGHSRAELTRRGGGAWGGGSSGRGFGGGRRERGGAPGRGTAEGAPGGVRVVDSRGGESYLSARP